MQLTEQERRTLRDMETRLTLEDPHLARSLSRPLRPRPAGARSITVPRSLTAASVPAPGGWLLALAVAVPLAVLVAVVATAAGLGGRGTLAIVTLGILLVLATVPAAARAWHNRKQRVPK